MTNEQFIEADKLMKEKDIIMQAHRIIESKSCFDEELVKIGRFILKSPQLQEKIVSALGERLIELEKEFNEL